MVDRWDSTDDDQALWGRLATMWETRDPMPGGLVERVLVAIATEDLDAEYELLHLVSRSRELAGARSASDAVTISFSGDSFSLLLRVSNAEGDVRRVDGWVTPAQAMKVTVKQRSRSYQADVDASGRFEIPRMPAGPSRFWLLADPSLATKSAADHPALFATPTFDL